MSYSEKRELCISTKNKEEDMHMSNKEIITATENPVSIYLDLALKNFASKKIEAQKGTYKNTLLLNYPLIIKKPVPAFKLQQEADAVCETTKNNGNNPSKSTKEDKTTKVKRSPTQDSKSEKKKFRHPNCHRKQIQHVKQ